jgi:hypothetical protein
MPVAEKKARPSRTPKLDEELAERYAKDPSAFRMRSHLNVVAGVVFLAFAAAIAFLALRVLGLGGGGDAVLLMGLFFLLIAITIFHDARWRMNLERNGGKLPRP